MKISAVPLERPGPWTIPRIYGCLPATRRAARDRTKVASSRAASREILSIARALLINPKKLLLLGRRAVAQGPRAADRFRKSSASSVSMRSEGISVLLVERNRSVPRSGSRRSGVMCSTMGVG